MRKLAVVVALIGAVALAAVATALEINSLREPKVIPSATVDSVKFVVHASNASGLPSGLMVFNGAGEELWARYWTDASGVWAFGPVMGIPASFILPKPHVERRGDSLYCIVELYCATDSLTAIWVDQ